MKKIYNLTQYSSVCFWHRPQPLDTQCSCTEELPWYCTDLVLLNCQIGQKALTLATGQGVSHRSVELKRVHCRHVSAELFLTLAAW